MRSLVRIPLALAAAIALYVPAGTAAADSDALFLNTRDLKWMDAPPNLPKGAKVTVLYGDPTKSGPFVIRLMAPPNYRIAPHWHSQTENLTIVSGTLYLGEGDKMDAAHAHTLKAGAYHYLPAKKHHYAFSKGASAIIQIHGDGPFDIVYLDEKDDPQKMAKR